MKTLKHVLPLVLALILLLAVLVSCADGDATGSAPEGGYGDIGNTGSVIDDRQIIREYSISLETKEFNKTLTDLRAAVTRVKGYEESASVKPPTGKQTGYAYIVFRVPTEQIDAFNESIKGIGSITSQDISTRDVTMTYADVEGRIASLKAEQTRLLALYEKASNSTETMNIDRRLAEVEGDLNSYTNQLLAMKDKIILTTYTFRIRDVEEYTEETNFFVRIGGAIVGSLKAFWGFIQGMIIASIYVLPFALLFTAIITGIVHLCRIKRFRARRAAKRAAAGAIVTGPVIPTVQAPSAGTEEGTVMEEPQENRTNEQ